MGATGGGGRAEGKSSKWYGQEEVVHWYPYPLRKPEADDENPKLYLISYTVTCIVGYGKEEHEEVHTEVGRGCFGRNGKKQEPRWYPHEHLVFEQDIIAWAEYLKGWKE